MLAVSGWGGGLIQSMKRLVFFFFFFCVYGVKPQEGTWPLLTGWAFGFLSIFLDWFYRDPSIRIFFKGL